MLCTKKENVLFCSDRFRTTINIIGDALGASIISHFCKEDLEEHLEDEICSLKTNLCDTPVKIHSNNET